MPLVSPYKRHRLKWSHCDRCTLCEGRRNTVLLRGTVPAPLLFVGEAPGTSENMLGKPFIGPAGKLLDQIIERAGIRPGSYAMTNLVACIPLDEFGEKTTQPPKFAIEACRERLEEIYELANPTTVVLVGQEAVKYAKPPEHVDIVELIHPAAILRMNLSQKGLAIQRCVVALSDL